MPWGSFIWGSSTWGGGVTGTGQPIRTPVAGLYIDNLHFDDSGEGLDLINTIPEDDEERVRVGAHILFQVVAYSMPIDPNTKVWVTVGSNPRELAYDEAGSGFQPGWDGPQSSITYSKSPASFFYDQIAVAIDPTSLLPSHTKILVEVQAKAGTWLLNRAYSFTTQYVEAPVVDEILWLTPRQARLRFREGMQQDEQPGGTLYLKTLTGGFEFVAPNKLTVRSHRPHTDWIGYWIGLNGSAYPQNNRYLQIASVDAVNGEITLDTRGLALKSDDGIDLDADGNAVRKRTLRGVLSSYRIEQNLTEESVVTCAYEPVVQTVRKPDVTEIPFGADITRYVVVGLHDDISIGRKYKWHLSRAINEFDEDADSTSIFKFTTPLFGSPEQRIKLWDFIPYPDQQEDEDNDKLFNKMAVVLQDALNVMWYRCDRLTYLHDPDNAPDSWIPYLLYTLGNPFRLPLNWLQERRLCAVLTAVYKKVGTAKIIEDALTFFLGGTFIVQPFQSADWWVLGTDALGVDTILGPSSKYAKNAYEIISSRELTDEEERIVRHIAETLDPAYMHLVRIMEPGEPSGTLQFWTLGASGLGFATGLAP
jgi:phage tail-like protein